MDASSSVNDEFAGFAPAATTNDEFAGYEPAPKAPAAPVERDEFAGFKPAPAEPAARAAKAERDEFAGFKPADEFAGFQPAPRSLKDELDALPAGFRKNVSVTINPNGKQSVSLDRPEFAAEDPAAASAFGKVYLDPQRPREAFALAKEKGWITGQIAQDMEAQLPAMEKAAQAKQAWLSAAEQAGINPDAAPQLAEMYGVGRGGAGIGGAVLAGQILKQLAIRNPIAAGATVIAGSVLGGYGAAKGYDAAASKLGDYFQAIDALAKAKVVDPESAAKGELATLILPLPGSLGKLATGAQMVNNARGAAAAAGFVGKELAGGAAIGGGSALAIQGIESALAGENRFDVGSAEFGAALGAALAGQNLRFRDYDTPQVAEILQRGLKFEQARASTPDGEAMPAGVEPLPPREKEVFNAAIGQLRSLQGPIDPASVQMQGRQVEGIGRGATELVTSGRGVPAGAMEQQSTSNVQRPTSNIQVPRPQATGGDGLAGEVAEASEIIPGGETTVFGTRGLELPAVYAWAPTSAIATSHSGEMMAPNSDYALTNTRDYSAPEERDKQLDVLKNFDPRRHVTDAPDASVGPSTVAQITDENGVSSLQRLGGNNRGYAIENLPAEKRSQLRDLENAKAPQFGLQPNADPGAELVRYVGDFDFRKPGERERAQSIVDALNPAPGLVQGHAKRAEIDATAVPAERLAGLSMNLAPADAQHLVRGLIQEGFADRNLTAAVAENPSQAQDYAQRLLANAAFRTPIVTEVRMDGTQPAIVRGVLDAAVPPLVRMRALQAGPAADAVTRALANALGYMNKLGLAGALEQTARQAEFDADSVVARTVAEGLRDALVLDAKGRPMAEPSVANAQTLFETIGRALAEYSPEPDLFGKADTVGETVMRAVSHFRDRGLASAAEGGSKPRRSLEPPPARAGAGEPKGALAYALNGSAYADVPLAGLPGIKPIEMPELVQLVKDLAGSEIVLKKMPKALGQFQGIGSGVVKLNPRIFQDWVTATKVLAHEIGHLIDYFGQETLKRGNLWGRLWSLRSFMKERWTSSGPTNKELRAELLALTRYWKPYDPLTAPKSYVSYRESGVELYADFISVLFNSPATAKQIAPNFCREFWNALGSKPEVKAALFDIQSWLSKPGMERLGDRRAKIDEMFAAGADAFERKLEERKERYAGYRGWVSRLKQAVFDRFTPAMDRAREAGTPTGDRVLELFDGHPLADNKHWRLLERMHRTIIEPLEKAGFSMDDLGALLFFDRVANESYPLSERMAAESGIATGGRTVIANPLGHTPKTARDGLLHMRLQNGIKRQTLLEAAAAKFHDEVFAVMQEAHKAGLLTDDQMRLIRDNRDHYAAFTPLEYVDTFVPATIHHQAGTLKEITNPFISTVLKVLQMQRAIEYQRLKVATVKLLHESFPGEIRPAKLRTLTGGRKDPIKPRERGWELLMLRDAGKPAWVEVPSEIATMFDRTPMPLLQAALDLINVPFRAFFYPLFIKFNPVFQFAYNPIRDVRRSTQNKPMGVGWGSLLRQLPLVKQFGDNPALEAVRKFVRDGQTDPIIQEMLANLALTPGDATFHATAGRPINSFERILQQHGMLPTDEQPWKLWELPGFKQIHKLGDAITLAARMNELLPKVVMYTELKKAGWAPADAAGFVRSYAGTPNFRKKGVHLALPNAVFPFFNVWQQGLAADAALARRGFKRRRDPGKPGASAAAWWMRWAMTSGIWTTMKVAAEIGLLGVILRKLMAGITGHDKSNYDVVPLGYAGESDVNPDGKVGLLRIPKDPTDRLLSGIFYNVVRSLALKAAQAGAFGDEIKDANAGVDSGLTSALASNVGLAASDVPGLNPLLKIGGAWRDYLSGLNPIDSYRNSAVLSDKEHLAGGWDSLKPMLAWTLEQTGLQNFVRYDPNAKTTTEIVIGNTPILNGLVKITDAGYRQLQNAALRFEESIKARESLKLSSDVQVLATEYWHLRSLGEKRSPVQETRYQVLNDWNSKVYEQLTEAIRAVDDGEMKESLRRTINDASQAFLPK
jgi:hypothetical protein